MAPEPVIFAYGNCQALKLTEALALSPEIASRAEVYYVPNFTDRVDIRAKENLARRATYLKDNAHRASAIVYQTEFWDPNANSILQSLPETCQRLAIPCLRNTTFWPNYFKDPIGRRARPPRREFPYGDSFLAKAVRQGASPREAVDHYLATDLNATIPLTRWRDKNLQMLRQTEAATDIRIAEWIADEFQSRLLFANPNHPVNAVIRRLTDQVLTGLGYAALPAQVGDAFEARPSIGERLMLPVHPSVIDALRVDYYQPGQGFPYWEDTLTYEEWALSYAETIRELATPEEMATQA